MMQGAPEELLVQVMQGSGGEAGEGEEAFEREVELEGALWTWLPGEGRSAWAATPYRITSSEAQVRFLLGGGPA